MRNTYVSASVPCIEWALYVLSISFTNGVNSPWFCSKHQLLNPSHPHDSKLWGNSGVVKGVEIHTVSKTTPCRDTLVPSHWENCPVGEITPVTKLCRCRAAAAGWSLASWWFTESVWSHTSLEGILLRISSPGCSQTASCRGGVGVEIRTCACAYSHTGTPHNSLSAGTVSRAWTCRPSPAACDSCWPFRRQPFGVRGRE